MESNTFSAIDWVVFSSVLAFSVGIGIFYAVCGGKQKTSQEYLLANKSMGFFPVGMSLLASLFTGIFVQGYTSDVYYRGGTVLIWGIFGQLGALWISARCFLPIYHKLQLTSIYEYLFLRFNKVVQIVGLVVFYLYLIIHTAIATFAMGLALTAVTNISLAEAILILSTVCMVYTFLFFIVIATLISVFIKCSIDVGGAKEVWRIAFEGGRTDFFNDFIWDAAEYATFWNMLLGSLLSWLPAMAIMQYQVQRFMSCKDLQTGYKALSLYGFGICLMTTLTVFSGVFLYSYYAYCDPLKAGYIQFSDELLPYFIIDSFHHIPGLSGLFVAGLCSLGLSTYELSFEYFPFGFSTMSSVLSALATVTGTDIVKRLVKIDNDTVYVWITKALVVFFSAVIVGCAFLMQKLGNIFAALGGFVGVINGPTMGIFILGVFFPRANSKGVLIGFVVSLSFGLWLLIGSLIYPTAPEMLPLSTERCIVVENVTTMSPPTSTIYSTTELPPDWPSISKFYALSKLWYPTVIMLLSVLFGLLGSALTGFNNPKDIDPDLICHIPQACCFCLPTRWQIWNKKEKECTKEPFAVKSDIHTTTDAKENHGFVELDDITTKKT